jgi:hypothetical protein
MLALAAIITVLAVVALINRQTDGSNQVHVTNFPTKRDIGIWSWKSPDSYSTQSLQSFAKQVKSTHVNTVYVDISAYADYSEIADLAQKQAKIDQLTSSLQSYIATFKHNGITVHALAGNSKWGNPDFWYLPQAIVAYVDTFNANPQNAQKLASLQFDIEYYNDPSFKEDKQTNLTDYLKLTESLVDQHLISGPTTPMGFTVPYWFDNETNNVIKVTFDGGAKYPMQHLVDTINALPRAQLTVLSYRNNAYGSDGIIEHAQQEVNYASNKAHVKVYIGLETTNVQPEKITYYHKHIGNLYEATHDINERFASKKAYNGFVINDAPGLIRLTKQ